MIDLDNRVFRSQAAILDDSCNAGPRLFGWPWRVISAGMPK